MDGYIATHRKMLDNPIVCKDSDYLAVWMYLLLNAAFKPTDVTFHGERMTLKPGQLTTGRKTIAEKFKISESKVQRILKRFESEHQIEQRTDRQCRLITIVSWDAYQISEQRFEPRLNNDWTTSEQRLNTKEECNKEINIYTPTIESVRKYVEDNKLQVDADYFFDYYEDKQWCDKGGKPIKNWKLKARTWHKREVKKNGNDPGAGDRVRSRISEADGRSKRDTQVHRHKPLPLAADIFAPQRSEDDA